MKLTDEQKARRALERKNQKLMEEIESYKRVVQTLHAVIEKIEERYLRKLRDIVEVIDGD